MSVWCRSATVDIVECRVVCTGSRSMLGVWYCSVGRGGGVGYMQPPGENKLM